MMRFTRIFLLCTAVALLSLGYAQTPAPQQVQTAGCVWNGQPCVPVPQPGTANPSLNHTQEPQAATVTISQQQSPFPLSNRLSLYSALVCSPVSRTISAGQIRQAAEGLGIAVQDASLNGQAVTTAASKTPTQRALTAAKWLAAGMSVSSAAISYVKQQGTIGNAKTWAIVATGTGALGAGIGILQPFLQTDANAQAATITQGVQAALMQADGLYSVSAGSCAKPVMMFGVPGKDAPMVVKGGIQ